MNPTNEAEPDHPLRVRARRRPTGSRGPVSSQVTPHLSSPGSGQCAMRRGSLACAPGPAPEVLRARLGRGRAATGGSSPTTRRPSTRGSGPLGTSRMHRPGRCRTRDAGREKPEPAVTRGRSTRPWTGWSEMREPANGWGRSDQAVDRMDRHAPAYDGRGLAKRAPSGKATSARTRQWRAWCRGERPALRGGDRGAEPRRRHERPPTTSDGRAVAFPPATATSDRTDVGPRSLSSDESPEAW